MSIIDVIKEKLLVLEPSHLEILDMSSQHQEHLEWPSEITHIRINITSGLFKDLKYIEMHKKIYDILKEEIPQIHAISINAKFA